MAVNAKKLDAIEKALIAKYKKASKQESEIVKKNEKIYEPITKAIKKLNEDIQKTSQDIVPFKPTITSSPRKLLPIDEESNTDAEDSGVTPKMPTILGVIAQHYLSNAKDAVFGIRYDTDKKKHMVGKFTVDFENDDLIIGGVKYTGTRGLWRLLTYPKAPGSDYYTSDDLQNYKTILLQSDALYHNNDKQTGKPKANRGEKWGSLVKEIWLSKDERSGSGILAYNDSDVEIKYISNLNELLKRIQFIQAEEHAGNNNFRNEKIGILHFFVKQLEDLMDSEKGTTYLIKFLSCIPSRIIENSKVGNGLFNTLLKKLPVEMHAPGYNYLGPGTKLDERLRRGDKPVNKLDEAAREHDIFYRDHEKTSDRHKADEILEQKAWSRVCSKDADINERMWAVSTGIAMHGKRKLGMGLKCL